MPAPARKTAAKKTASAAAAAEATGDEDDITVSFRNQEFVIRDALRGSFRMAMAVASGSQPQMVYEMIDPADRGRFIDAAAAGEPFNDVAVEFFEAYAEASGQGK